MPPEWYVRVGNVAKGPVTAEVLKQLAVKGQLKPEMLLRKGPSGNWIPAGRFKGLFPASATVAAPAPAPEAPQPEARPPEETPAPVSPSESEAAAAEAPQTDTASAEESPADELPPDATSQSPEALEPASDASQPETEPAEEIEPGVSSDEAIAGDAEEESPTPVAVLEREPVAKKQKAKSKTKEGVLSSSWVRLPAFVLGILGVFLLFSGMIIVRGYYLKPSDELVGKWEMIDGEGRAQFSADGTVRLTKSTGDLSATWRRLDAGRVKIESRALGPAAGEVYEVAIKDDELTMKKADGVTTKYKKVTVWKK